MWCFLHFKETIVVVNVDCVDNNTEVAWQSQYHFGDGVLV